ncbi:hypothetical protein CEP54_011476 [Fusarium duplospermum]|uniref:Uncharacterized protein n=1 Tax=Fusarium duplospermum TaxID=1325734 RepID=A0A428PE26_9HYPO|nr:hypothetical protein CEP54_011476 [Fusarium duplospermum]
MEAIDDSELWMSGEEDEYEDEYEQRGEMKGDPTFFTLEMSVEGQPGGFHVRNGLDRKQRPAVSSFGSGSKKKPAFWVSCTARAIVHGTLDDKSKTKATLLVYDFSFFSYRKTRIKDATICFEFEKAAENRGSQFKGPKVVKVAPYGKHVMMQTTETVMRKVVLETGVSGGVVATANTKGGTEMSVEKTTTHAAEITGDNPCDDWGNYFMSNWYLDENKSQKNGIVSHLRTCVLLTRDSDEAGLASLIMHCGHVARQHVESKKLGGENRFQGLREALRKRQNMHTAFTNIDVPDWNKKKTDDKKLDELVKLVEELCYKIPR